MKKIMMLIILTGVIFCRLGLASETSTELDPRQGNDVKTVMTRGWMNFFTFPGEIVRTGQNEKQNHPKAWPLTYAPRLVANVIVRATSSVNDMFVLPAYVWATKDPRPITYFFDMPDYVWEKV